MSLARAVVRTTPLADHSEGLALSWAGWVEGLPQRKQPGHLYTAAETFASLCGVVTQTAPTAEGVSGRLHVAVGHAHQVNIMVDYGRWYQRRLRAGGIRGCTGPRPYT